MSETIFTLVTKTEALEKLIAAIATQPVIGVDTETTGLDPMTSKVRLLQISTSKRNFVVDLFKIEAFANQSFREIFTTPEIIKIFHNAKFDMKMLLYHFHLETRAIFDTMLASQLIGAGRSEGGNSLVAVAARYLNEEVDKSQQVSDWSGELSDEQYEYAAKDAELLIPLREKLVQTLVELKMIDVAKLEFDCVLPLCAMELAGMNLEADCWRQIVKKVESEHDILSAELKRELATGIPQLSFFDEPNINLDSPAQVTEALQRMGIKVEGTRGWQLQAIAKEHKVIEKLLEYRHAQKSLSSYGANFLQHIHPVTGRVHSDFRQIGATGGRMSCVTGDTLISTPKGLRQIKDLKQNDIIKTSYGCKSIENVYKTGRKQVFKITLKDGRLVKATADHRFLSGQADDWKRLDELQSGDILFVSLQADEFDDMPEPVKLPVPDSHINSRKAVLIPETISTELCELMGLIVADGFLGKRRVRPANHRLLSGGAPADYDRVAIAFDWKDEELISRIISYGKRLFGQPFVEVKARTARVLQLASTKVAEFLAGLGLSGNAHTKSIPQIIISAHPIYQAAFLRGLFEGDGGKWRDKIFLTSVNLNLLRQAQILLSNLGVYATIRRRNDLSGFSGAIRYQLTIYSKSDLASFMERIGFLSSRKNAPYNFVDNHRDGTTTPFRISGRQLYFEAAESGLVQRSRADFAFFTPYYQNTFVRDTNAERLIQRFGSLPCLQPVKKYLELKLRAVAIESIVADGIESVYDITVEDVHEFIANGLVLHNCSDPNLQQVPNTKEHRSCFRAPAGRKLCIADYSQIEVRILADWSQDVALTKALISGEDLHCVTASQMFNIPLGEVTKEQRSAAKQLNYGLMYGLGAQGLAARIDCSNEEAEQLIKKYFVAYSGVAEWLREAANRAVQTRESRTRSGRLICFTFDPNDRSQVAATQRFGKNSPIQGSSADIIKRALALIYEAIQPFDAKVVNCIHDEIVIEAAEAEAQECAKVLEHEMVKAAREFIRSVPVTVDVIISEAWLK